MQVRNLTSKINGIDSSIFDSSPLLVGFPLKPTVNYKEPWTSKVESYITKEAT